MFGGLGKKEPEPEPEDEATQLRNMNPDEMSGEQLQQRIANGAQDVSVTNRKDSISFTCRHIPLRAVFRQKR